MSSRNLRWLTQPQLFRSLILSLTLMMASATAMAATGGEAGEADEFLNYGSNVRSLGMGRAYVALADDASALYYNAAGLMRLARGYSVYGSHFRPFYESNYSFISLAVSRPDPTATGLKKFFFGPSAAWGFSLVHLGSDGYEQRDANDNLIDENFGLYQQAFMVAFAREVAGTAGILSYGATLKMVRHGVSDATAEYDNSGSSVGLDIGAQLQMINPPLIKELTRVPLVGTFFKLKHLMPLRLGVSIRNVISPRVGYGGESDKYPTALRVGASYRLPTNWLVQNSGVFLVSDYEWLFDDMDRLIRLSRRVEFRKVRPGAGQYFGTEFQYQTEKLQLLPRIGLSHVYDDWKFSTGFGLAFETSGLDFKFDFAHGFHEDLSDDQRISLTIRFGGKRDADYFVGSEPISTSESPDTRWSIDPCLSPEENLPDDSGKSTDTVNRSGISMSRLSSILRVVSGYPDQWQEALPAAIALARELDTANAARYLELVGGAPLAVDYADKAIAAFQADRGDEASDLALKAIAEFGEVAAESPHMMGDYFNALLGQCKMIHAATLSGSAAQSAWSRAAEILSRSLANVKCLKLHFLTGTCFQMVGDYPQAAKQFEAALRIDEDDSHSMRLLSRYELSKSLMESGQADSSLNILKTFFENPNSTADSLTDHYPRFLVYPDRRLSDDALYMAAEYYRSQGSNRAREALISFGNVCRFYPGLDKCRDSDIEKQITELIEQLSK